MEERWKGGETGGWRAVEEERRRKAEMAKDAQNAPGCTEQPKDAQNDPRMHRMTQYGIERSRNGRNDRNARGA